MNKDKKIQNKCREILSFLGDIDYEYVLREDGMVEEYIIYDNGDREMNGLYKDYYEALMSWKDTERDLLLKNHIILTRSEYEMMGLLKEYKHVISTRDNYINKPSIQSAFDLNDALEL